MYEHIATWLARAALATAFLSAVADRFGVWGPPGAENVAWGNMTRFLAYTATLNWYLPAAAVPLVGWTVSVLEAALAVALLIGYRLRWTATLAGLVLLAFAVAMSVATGVKTAFDASVYSAAAAAFLLAASQTARNQGAALPPAALGPPPR